MPDLPPRHRTPRANLPDGRQSASARGYDSKWRAVRLDYLRRHPLCSEPGCNQGATEVDHIISLRRGGTHDDANLCGYCKSHHSAKTCKMDQGFGRKPKSN